MLGSVKEEIQTQEVEEEEEEVEEFEEQTITQIEEIYRETIDDGKTWRTMKKITTITPQGTSENIIVLHTGITNNAHCNSAFSTMFNPK